MPAHLVRWDLIKFMLSLADPGAGCLLLPPIVDLCCLLKDNLPLPQSRTQSKQQFIASSLGITSPKRGFNIHALLSCRAETQVPAPDEAGEGFSATDAPVFADVATWLHPNSLI